MLAQGIDRALVAGPAESLNRRGPNNRILFVEQRPIELDDFGGAAAEQRTQGGDPARRTRRLPGQRHQLRSRPLVTQTHQRLGGRVGRQTKTGGGLLFQRVPRCGVAAKGEALECADCGERLVAGGQHPQLGAPHRNQQRAVQLPAGVDEPVDRGQGRFDIEASGVCLDPNSGGVAMRGELREDRAGERGGFLGLSVEKRLSGLLDGGGDVGIRRGLCGPRRNAEHDEREHRQQPDHLGTSDDGHGATAGTYCGMPNAALPPRQ